MKNFFKNIKQFNFIAILLVAFIFILIIANAIFSGRSSDNSTSTLENESLSDLNKEDETSINQNKDAQASKSNFIESQSLLEVLPFYNDTFYVDVLPLENDSNPKVVVELRLPNAKEKFLFWVSLYEYTNIDFIYVDVYDPTYEDYLIE